MLDLNFINSFFPPQIATNAAFQKHILKEYIQLMVLDFLAATPYVNQLALTASEKTLTSTAKP